MRNRRSQLGVFLIMGLVILIGAGFVYYITSNISQSNIKAGAEKTAKIAFLPDSFKNFLDTCLQNIAKEGVSYTAQRGGYFNLPKYSYNDSFIKTAYYFYEDRSLMPKLEIIENSISEYMKEEVPLCFEELKNITEYANIGYEIKNINTQIINDSIIINAEILTNIKSNDIEFKIKKFQVRLDGDRLYDVYNFSKFIIDKQLEDKYALCLSCIINEGAANDLYTNIENVGNNTFLFTISYNYTKTSSFYKFSFANKYKEISCTNLPIGADTYFLERFTKDCLEQEIEKYNYTLKVGDIGNLNASVGKPFTAKINATGINLTFTAFTDLFSIEQKTGLINFTPIEDQIGDHIFLIRISDGFGNKNFKTSHLNISKTENENN